ncbi:MAG TPA: hypothetical protein VIV12_18905 [Streptosporangiaceae bacterium]
MAKPPDIIGNTWQVLLFAFGVLIAGLVTMAALTDVSAGSIASLATAVLGVVGTHVGHVAGHELATKRSGAEQFAAGIERLADLHQNGHIKDQEFADAKQKLIDRL